MSVKNEEPDSLLNGYKDIYIEGDRIATPLQVKINWLKQRREAEEKEKEWEMTLKLQRMMVDYKEWIGLEILNVKKLNELS